MAVVRNELCCISCGGTQEIASDGGEEQKASSCPACGQPMFARLEFEKLKFLKVLKQGGRIG